MFSAKTLINDQDWTISLTVHTYNSDKQLGTIMNQNNYPIAYLLRIFSKPQFNYTMIEKELIVILECLK